MADILKRVNRGIPPLQRTQNFTNSDAGTGDILLVRDSLGRSARNVAIEVTGAPVRVRFNVHQTIFARRSQYDTLGRGDLENTASGIDYVDRSGAYVDVEAGTVWEMSNEIVVDDIELVTVSGQFDIFVS